jgi:hypothetical protein
MNPEIITTGDVRFGAPEQVTVADLQPGDFIVTIAAQSGVRGYRWNSAVAEISDARFGAWRFGPARRKQPVKSRKIRLMSVDGMWDVPCFLVVTVRRPV